MSNFPSADTPIKTIGLGRQVCEVNGQTLTRRNGTQEWTKHAPESEAQLTASLDSASLYLSLIHHAQGPGEPFHWSLFVAHENHPGSVYQVKGDAEFMTYEPEDSVDETQAESFSTLYQLAVVSEEQARVIKQVAECEPPPHAPNRQYVIENCQGWSVRVIAKLVERGIVPPVKLEMAISMMQPV
ncbi:uncharacterized protein N7511_010521 [Penicillium nucicola]|uniref:uncharacterized protein n=1 Tax=Penicillium nucicola TaxID=1850975 RepID=UPI002544F4FE|nr:uncharacterized protein N7511_010521 [Penicillium nucicola]KAJ5748825.1 hypothetical protein N7511_010521 [Penicillium nucicola]